MNPTLESVIFASPSVALKVNQLSRELPKEDRLFENETLNTTIIFKYPNFDAAQAPSENIIPGLEEFLTDKSEKKPIRTAIFVPKDAKDVRLGGFGIFMDDDKFPEMSERYLGFKIDKSVRQPDLEKLGILENCPSFDPFLVKEAFDLAGTDIDPSYVSISEEDAQQVRGLIQAKLKPIVAKALNLNHEGRIENSSRQFLETIWDPQAETGAHFIAAFGIGISDAPKVFSAWKGVAYFDNEFNQRQSDSRKLVAWLKSDASTPSDYAKLSTQEKQQIDMFRKSVTSKILNVSNNISLILNRYQKSYRDFIDHDKPKEFQKFLMGAEKYYWTLGGCNGVLAQVIGTWKRYMQAATGMRLNYEVNERLLKVCDAILRARSNDKQIAL